MKKMVLGIILSLSVTFAIGISKVSASNYDITNVNLSNISSLQYYSSNYSLALSRLSYNGGNKLFLVFWNSNLGRLQITDTGDYVNDICTEQGACFSRFASNISGNTSPKYKAYYTSTDNGDTWTLEYVNGYSTNLITNGYLLKTTVDLYGGFNSIRDNLYFHSGYEYLDSKLSLSYQKISDNKGVITADYRYYVDELVDFDYTLLDSSLCMLDYYISYVDFAGVEHNLCDVGNNTLLIPVDVYYNGTYTFYIKNWYDNSILDSASIDISDLLSIDSDYTRYDIVNTDSSNDHQFGVFVSQFQYDTDYTIYISPNFKRTINAIYYLDSNGDMVYSYSDFSYNLASNGFYYFTFNIHDTNIKTIYFNLDVYKTEVSTIFLLIDSSLYVDIRDLLDDNNYDCSSLSDWSSPVSNVTRCKIIYNSFSGGSDITTSVNTKTIDDSVDDPFSVDGNRDNTDNFTITFRNMFLQFSKPFYIIGNAYTNFMQVIPIQMMYVIYLGFGLTMLAIFIKIWL